MQHPMMTCGHAANSVCSASRGQKFDPPIPSCAICDCLEVAEVQPVFDGRKARCSYYSKSTGRNNECNYGQSRDPVCTCEQPSSSNLPFFASHPEKEFDEFYCGCHSWD